MTTKREAEAAEKKSKVRLKMNKKEQFLEQWPDANFNISKTCRAIKISREAVYKWAKEDPEFERAMQESYEAMNDIAEAALLKQIKAGNIAAIIFYLKCRAKDRGYIETLRVDQAVLGQVNHNHTIAYDYDRLSRSELESLRASSEGDY